MTKVQPRLLCGSVLIAALTLGCSSGAGTTVAGQGGTAQGSSTGSSTSVMSVEEPSDTIACPSSQMRLSELLRTRISEGPPRRQACTFMNDPNDASTQIAVLLQRLAGYTFERAQSLFPDSGAECTTSEIDVSGFRSLRKGCTAAARTVTRLGYVLRESAGSDPCEVSIIVTGSNLQFDPSELVAIALEISSDTSWC